MARKSRCPETRYRWQILERDLEAYALAAAGLQPNGVANGVANGVSNGVSNAAPSIDPHLDLVASHLKICDTCAIRAAELCTWAEAIRYRVYGDRRSRRTGQGTGQGARRAALAPPAPVTNPLQPESNQPGGAVLLAEADAPGGDVRGQIPFRDSTLSRREDRGAPSKTSLFGQLIAVASLRDERPGAGANLDLFDLLRRLRSDWGRLHRQVFTAWLKQTRRRQKTELDAYLEGEPDRKNIVARLMDLGEALIPHGTTVAERKLFLGDLSLIQSLCRTEPAGSRHPLLGRSRIDPRNAI